MGLKNVEHEYIVCKVFPETFESKDYTWYFTQPTSSITSWYQFENTFLEKFVDDKTLEYLVMGLARIKMEPTKKVKHFNQRFLTLENKIPHDSMPTENLQIYIM